MAGLETTAHEDMQGDEIEALVLPAVWPEYVRDGWQEAWVGATTCTTTTLIS